ncbi:O-antigen ligase [Algoriphagus sp. AK58]|uniref:O-antigen ligase family protein n=1 Tax=Algoriphagus sp. AK58 TaxID=1406877 RepID=UPI00164F1ABA|nr:O-antigen ligase family protein [Algoriphagus sp. AK58]MBC6369207.1 hypothetical protein [Algoriphagus sp. AK58]
MDNLRIIFLYSYLFLLPIENWSPWGGPTDLFRPALIMAFGYIGLSFFKFRNFRISSLKAYLSPIFYLWFCLLVSSIIFFINYPSVDLTLNFTFIICVVSFWLLSNDLRKYPKLYFNFIVVVVLNGFFISLLSFFGIGIDVGYMGRESLLGNNANIIGLNVIFSFFSILYLIIENPMNISSKRYLLLLLFPFLVQTIARTGSKGALLLLMIGLFVYFTFLNKPIKFKVPIFVLGILGSLFVYSTLLENSVLSERWENFIEEGNTTGRTERWFFAWNIFLNNPLIGVGENGIEFIPSPFVGLNEPHNVYLYVLACGGIIGFFFLSLFLFRLCKNVFINYLSNKSLLPVVFLILVLMHWFKAGGGLNSKIIWIYFAFILHSGYKNRFAINY